MTKLTKIIDEKVDKRVSSGEKLEDLDYRSIAEDTLDGLTDRAARAEALALGVTLRSRYRLRGLRAGAATRRTSNRATRR